MAEVTNELIYEVLKAVQFRMTNIEDGVREVKGELVAIRGHMLATQSDIANIYDKLGKIEYRVERIERRLDIVPEPAQ